MRDKKQQEGRMEHTDFTEEITGQTERVNGSRRRFTQSGLAVSGVLFTLTSRAALGGTLVCKSPSGFLSGNTSQHGTPSQCSGRTPGYWGTNTDKQHKWPSPYKAGTCTDTKHSLDYQSWTGGTKFNDAYLGFGCSGVGSHLAAYSMMQVILLEGTGDPFQLGAHIVAALLNAKMGWTPVLTEAQVRAIFNEYDLKGYFEPTAGVRWSPEDIVRYLQSTMTL